MRRLVIDSASIKMLGGVPPKHFRQLVMRLFELLKEPRAGDARPLKGFPFHRISVGEYRVVFNFNETEVRVLLIGKRNDDEIYKALARKH